MSKQTRASVILAGILFFLGLGAAYSEELVLKSGKKLQGKILEQKEGSIKIDTGSGVGITYFSHEIDTLDGEPWPVKPKETRAQLEGLLALSNAPKSEKAAQPFVGFWKSEKLLNLGGILIESVGEDRYSVTFCGPKGCLSPAEVISKASLTDGSRFQFPDEQTMEFVEKDGDHVTFYRSQELPNKSSQDLTSNREKIKAFIWALLLKASPLLALVFLIYFAYALPLYLLSKKEALPLAWLSWIPFADFYVKCRLGDKPWWWFIFFYGYAFSLQWMKTVIYNFILVFMWPLLIMDIKVWFGLLDRFDLPRRWLFLLYLAYPLGPIVLFWYLTTKKRSDIEVVSEVQT